MNRDQLASSMTKRESAAVYFMARTAAFQPKGTTNQKFARAVTDLVDALFDALEAPRELQDHHDDFDHDGTP